MTATAQSAARALRRKGLGRFQTSTIAHPFRRNPLPLRWGGVLFRCFSVRASRLRVQAGLPEACRPVTACDGPCWSARRFGRRRGAPVHWRRHGTQAQGAATLQRRVPRGGARRAGRQRRERAAHRGPARRAGEDSAQLGQRRGAPRGGQFCRAEKRPAGRHDGGGRLSARGPAAREGGERPAQGRGRHHRGVRGQDIAAARPAQQHRRHGGPDR